MVRVLVVVLGVLVAGACEQAERCCEEMFPYRAQPADILQGYAGRLVYNQNDLIGAISDTAVRRIVIAESMTLTQTITLPATRAGLVVEGLHGATITIPSSFSGDAVLSLLGDRQVLRGLHADGGEGEVYLASVGADDVTIEGNVAEGGYLVSTSAASARLIVTRNRVTGGPSNEAAIDVIGEAMVISENHIEGIDAEILVGDASSYTRIVNNKIGSGSAGAPVITIQGANTSYCVVSGNTAQDGNGSIVTTGSGGSHSAVLANNAGFS